MGIMQNKVTRRIALGTIAGGLGGTILAIRALKGRYVVELPSKKMTDLLKKLPKNPQYESDWDRYVKLVNVPIKEIQGPSTFTLDYRLQEGMTFRAVSLTTTYDSRLVSSQYPELPLAFSVVDGWIDSIPSVVDEKPALSLRPETHIRKSPSGDQTLPISTCVVIPTNGNLQFYEPRSRELKALSSVNSNPACLCLAQGLTLQLPTAKPLDRAATWTIPESTDYGVELPCRVVGFAQIAQWKTVKLLAEKHLDRQECQRYYARASKRANEPNRANEQAGGDPAMVELEKKVKAMGGSPVMLARAKEGLKLYREQQKDRLNGTTVPRETRLLQITSFVDMKTALIVRQECTMTISGSEANDLPIASTGVVIHQLFQG